MAKLPGAEAMLRGLTRFDASRRWSVRRALRSGLFHAHRCEQGDDAPAGTVRFDAYLAEEGA